MDANGGRQHPDQGDVGPQALKAHHDETLAARAGQKLIDREDAEAAAKSSGERDVLS